MDTTTEEIFSYSLFLAVLHTLPPGPGPGASEQEKLAVPGSLGTRRVPWSPYVDDSEAMC